MTHLGCVTSRPRRDVQATPHDVDERSISWRALSLRSLSRPLRAGERSGSPSEKVKLDRPGRIAAIALVTILGQARRVERTPIVLQIGGNTYKIHATAPEAQVRRLAQVVEDKLREIAPHAALNPQSFLLVALAFAHEAEQERDTRRGVVRDVRALLNTFLDGIERALRHGERTGASAREFRVPNPF